MKFSRIILICTIIYATLYSFFQLTAKERMPEEWLFSTSLILTLFFIAGYCFCSCLPSGMLWTTIFLYHLTGSLLLEKIIFYYTGDIFGLYRGDGPLYYYFAPETTGWSWGKTTYIHDLKIDDWGFPALLRILYSMGQQPEQYFFLLILVNSLCVAVSSYFLYKTAKKIVEKQYAKIAAILWGLSTYALFSTVHWLKENFFCVIIVLALYGLLDACEKSRGRQFITFWGAAFLTIFFRRAVPFIFLISFCGKFVTVKFIKKYMVLLIVIGIFSFLLLDPFLKLLGIPGGLSGTMEISKYRISHTDASFGFALLIQGLSVLFGPFPNFIGQETTPLFLYNFFLLLNCLLSIYFLYGFYQLYRAESIYFSAILGYWILNALMMIVSFVALDFRYRIVSYPLFLLLALYGFKMRCLNKDKIKKHAQFLLGEVGVLLLIVVYNFR